MIEEMNRGLLKQQSLHPRLKLGYLVVTKSMEKVRRGRDQKRAGLGVRRGMVI